MTQGSAVDEIIRFMVEQHDRTVLYPDGLINQSQSLNQDTIQIQADSQVPGDAVESLDTITLRSEFLESLSQLLGPLLNLLL